MFTTGDDDTGKLEYLTEILDQLQERGLYGQVNYIDMTNLNSPTMGFLGRFTVKLGESGETEYRLAKLLSAVSQLTEYDRGTIDVSYDGEQVVFSPF